MMIRSHGSKPPSFLTNTSPNQESQERRRPTYDLAAAGSVGVVVKCHNYGRFLRQALDSVAAQTRQPERVVIVLDRCTDESRDVAAGYARPGWSVIEGDYGSGSASHNAGVRALPDVDFLVALDADNWLHPEVIKRLLPAMRVTTVGVVYPDMVIVDEAGNRTGEAGLHEPWDYDRVRRQNYVDTCTLSRRRVWEDVGGWQEDIHHLDDWAFNLQTSRAGWEFVHVPGAEFYYRRHPAQNTWPGRQDEKAARLAVMRKTFTVTVVTPFAGRAYALDRYFESLNKLDWDPGHLRVVALDSSGDSGFGRALRKRLSGTVGFTTYVSVPHRGATGETAIEMANPLAYRVTHELEVNRLVGGLYQAAKPYLGDADLVLTWEDDVEPPEGALLRLVEEMAPDVGAVGGLLRQRFDGIKSEWRFTDTGIEVVDVQPGQVAQVDATSFGFTLFRRQVWREIRFRAEPQWGAPNRPYYDWAFGCDMRALGWRWLAHGDVVLRHWQENATWV